MIHPPVLPHLARTPPRYVGQQVLGRVEAHISALRDQLNHKTPGVTSLSDDTGSSPGGRGGVSFPSAGGPRARGDPVGMAETHASGGGTDASAADGVGGNTVGVEPLPVETRGNYHLSPTPAERSGNEDGLTEAEDMRLNRLLRSSSSPLASTPPPPPPSGALTTPVAGQRGFSSAGSGPRTMAGGDPGSNLSEGGFGGIWEAPCELFGASPIEETVTGNPRAWSKCSFDASRRIISCGKEEGDDLEDISDGGFHPGCWKRKYVRGEMR